MIPDEPASAVEPPPQRSGRAQVLMQFVGLGIVAVVLWFLFTRVADWREVRAAVLDLSPAYWALLLGVAMLRFAVEAVLLVAVTPGLSWLRAVPAFLAPAAAASIIPGPSDLAARYAMYRRWGLDATETSSSVILWLIYSTMAKVSLPLIALALLVLFDRSQTQVETVAIIAAGVLIALAVAGFVLLRSERTARRLGRGAGLAAHRIASWFRISTPDTLAEDLAERAARFRDQTGHIIRSRSHMAAPGAYAQQAALFLILLVSVRAVGITPQELDWVAIFAAFALVQVITTVPVTPAGLGVAEVAYVALLAVGSTGGLVDEVTAAALIYRIFSWLIVIPAGGIAWLWWSRTVGDPDMAETADP